MKPNAISKTILSAHIIIVIFISLGSYFDSLRIPESQYFNFRFWSFGNKDIGDMLNLTIYILPIFIMPILALIIKHKWIQINNGGQRLLCHVLLSAFQLFAIIPLFA